MEKTPVSKSIFTKKTQDYTFVVLFLSVFSIFIVFAISPSLKTAFSLKKEEVDLKKVDTVYEQKIMNISSIQNQIEESREKLPLFNQAVSQYPEVNKMVDDVKTIADKNEFVIKKANIADVNLIQSKKQIDHVRLIVEGKTGFENLMSFMNELFQQRRLKTISNLSISQDREATSSGLLQVILTIDGFYL
ncbi:type 4a pilus biogenesis protein PilO [Candidatus Roizmanbacteria bacterium]|nr:type 4a pilus biogenesis protein PilO [Candidatus Roizmanbacteria bacterium]